MKLTIKTYPSNTTVFVNETYEDGEEETILHFSLDHTADNMMNENNEPLYDDIEDYLEHNVPEISQMTGIDRDELIRELIDDMSISIQIDKYLPSNWDRKDNLRIEIKEWLEDYKHYGSSPLEIRAEKLLQQALKEIGD